MKRLNRARILKVYKLTAWADAHINRRIERSRPDIRNCDLGLQLWCIFVDAELHSQYRMARAAQLALAICERI